MDLIKQYLENLKNAALAHPIEFLGVAATIIGAVLLYFFTGLGAAIRGHFYKQKDEVINGFSEAPQAFVYEQPAFEITLDEYEARQEALKRKVEKELEAKHGEERIALQRELDEVKARLREPDKALEDYKETIRELEDRLGNRETKDEQAVQAALDQGNLDQAQEILEKMAAQDDLAIMKAANTAYSLGQIAEEKVDWPAAAEHYQKAANLSSSYANLIKAHEFTHWAGD